MKFTYRHTLFASYLGYVTQAAVNNLAPLLFVIFQTDYGVSLERIGFLISINFCVQILVDLICAKYVDRLGYRNAAVLAHICCTVGLICLGVLPGALPDPYAGLVVAMVITAIGGGLIEVLISPIVESLPGDEKASAMSLLHSFYCWGHMGVVLLSTLYFALAGSRNWMYLPVLWAALPLFNAFFFARVPLCPLVKEGEGLSIRRLFGMKVFWVLMALMICAGASELAMSQWSSLFAELGLGVSKTLGDLLGPCAFALMMGLARLWFGIRGERVNLRVALSASGALCVAGYLITVFAPWPLLSLAGCALCGLSVALMWPGTFSLAAASCPLGGTAMFALLAMGGDVGCALGPGLVGLISNAAQNGGWSALTAWMAGDGVQLSLKAGLLCAMVFPLLLVAFIRVSKKVH